MKSRLSELSLEELWSLFPIILSRPDPEWKNWFEKERKDLEDILSGLDGMKIHHIGSTAIRGIWAKPIVDILIEFQNPDDLARACRIMEENGWICMVSSKERISLNRGYTEQGFAERVFHAHLRREGDHDEILFCRWLNDHPETAKAYESLKLSLWKEFEHDRDGYTKAKAGFVREVMEQARKEIPLEGETEEE